MGLVAVTAGCLYALLNFFWLRKMKLPGLEKDDTTVGKIIIIILVILFYHLFGNSQKMLEC